MKKVLIAMLAAAVLLSGCGLFHSNKDWKAAKQENPLEVPPNLDRPNVSDALTIPSVNPSSDTDSASGAASGTGSAGAAGKALALDSDVDDAYRQVGMALAQGSVGNVSAQDQTTHSYQVQVPSGAKIGQGKGFFERHFSNLSNDGGKAGNANAQSESSNQAQTSTVSVQVTADSDGGSIVTANGSDAAVAKVMKALRARLGG